MNKAIAILGLSILLGGCAYLLYLGGKAGIVPIGCNNSMPDDKDMQVVWKDIPKSENAYFLYEEAGSKLNLSEKERNYIFKINFKKDGWDIEELERIVANNKAALNLFNQATQKPSSQVPTSNHNPGRIERKGISLLATGRLCRLKAAEIKVLIDKKQEEKALAELLRLRKFAKHYSKTLAPTSSSIAHEAENLSLKGLKYLLNNSNGFSEMKYRDLNQSLSDFKVSADLQIQSRRINYQDHIVSLNEQDYIPYFSCPNQNIRTLLKQYRSCIKKIKTVSPEVKKELPDFDKQIQKRQDARLWEPNGYGLKVSTYTPPFCDSNDGNHFRDLNSKASLLQVMAALKAYKQKMGTLPISLEELVPTYMTEIPTDGYHGKPIYYQPKWKLVYAFREDLDAEYATSAKEFLSRVDAMILN